MTDLDKLLGHSAPHVIQWLEERKATKVGELIGQYRLGKDGMEMLRDKTAEITVLTDLISTMKAKQEQLRNWKAKL